ncbi:MAG: hypothetical protein OEU32_18325, partial [Acidimicrobiia bacterium]|nr:hypothetical protein [Acidimicrobiia bacterium]
MRPADPRSTQYPPPGSTLGLDDDVRLDVATPGRTFSMTALTFAAAALVLPLVAGVAIGFAVAAKKRGDPWAPIVLRVSIASLFVGFAIGGMATSVDLESISMAA